MRFKSLVFIFNAAVLLAFAFLFLLPPLLTGSQLVSAFWQKSWYISLILLGMVIVLNTFLVINHKPYSLVMNHSWEELSTWLGRSIYIKKHIWVGRVRLLINAYLLLSDIEGLARLEAFLQSNKPGLLKRFALLFGITRLLRNKPEEAENFCKPYLEDTRAENRNWLRFVYAFSLVLQKKYLAAKHYCETGMESRDPILALLSVWTLLGMIVPSSSADADRARLEQKAAKIKVLLKSARTRADWQRLAAKAKLEIHIVILSKLIDDALAWLFA